MELKDIWDKESQSYAEKALSDVVNTMELPDYWMPEKEEYVLEAGCGAGGMMKVFAASGGEVFGVDISLEMLKHAKKRGKVALGDVRFLPFKDASFDYVSSLGVIEHFKESKEALCECVRVLKKRGRLFINVPNRYSFYFPLRWLTQKMGLYSLEYSKHFVLKELIDMGSNSGLVFKDWRVQRFVPKEARGIRKTVMSVANLLDHIFGLFYRGWGNFVYVLFMKEN